MKFALASLALALGVSLGEAAPTFFTDEATFLATCSGLNFEGFNGSGWGGQDSVDFGDLTVTETNGVPFLLEANAIPSLAFCVIEGDNAITYDDNNASLGIIEYTVGTNVNAWGFWIGSNFATTVEVTTDSGISNTVTLPGNAMTFFGVYDPVNPFSTVTLDVFETGRVCFDKLYYGLIGSSSCGGDPHFLPWLAAKRETFHGECDLVLAQNEEFQQGAGLDLHVRTKIHDFYSYVEAAALKVGSRIFEFHPKLFLLDNEMFTAEDLPMSIKGDGDAEYKLSVEVKGTERHDWTLELGNTTIVFHFYKHFSTVKINGSAIDLKNAQGLLGEYTTGLWKNRHGDVSTSFEDHAFHWQVNPLEGDPELFKLTSSEGHPQLPYERCRMPTVGRPTRRLRSADDQALHNEASQACNHVAGVHDFNLCVEDVMTTKDIGLAELW